MARFTGCLEIRSTGNRSGQKEPYSAISNGEAAARCRTSLHVDTQTLRNHQKAIFVFDIY